MRSFDNRYYEDIKKQITVSRLKSETDSEVLAGLIDSYFKGPATLLEATKKALSEVKGTFGLAIISQKTPGPGEWARRLAR